MRALSTSLKAMLLYSTGSLDAGLALAEEARQVHRGMNDHEGRGVATSFLAQMSFAKGDHDRALTLYHDALVSLEIPLAVQLDILNAVDEYVFGYAFQMRNNYADSIDDQTYGSPVLLMVNIGIEMLPSKG